MSGRPTRATVESWAGEVEVVAERIGPCFSGSEPRRRAVDYLRALLGDSERKNGWQMAEHLGDTTPDGVQHLLARTHWDADAVRNDLAEYVRQHLADPDGALVVDETGFLKKGTKSCGVARQYSGPAGQIENSQVGVFLAYAVARGQALIDRALYLPKEWTDDRTRCRAAGVPDRLTLWIISPFLQNAIRGSTGQSWRCPWLGWRRSTRTCGSDGAIRCKTVDLSNTRVTGHGLKTCCSACPRNPRPEPHGPHRRGVAYVGDAPVAEGTRIERDCGDTQRDRLPPLTKNPKMKSLTARLGPQGDRPQGFRTREPGEGKRNVIRQKWDMTCVNQSG